MNLNLISKIIEISALVVLTITFFFVFFSPTKSVIISVNSYHEAYMELIYFIFAWIVIGYSWFKEVSDHAKRANL